ncbi:MAG: ATP synthase subunit b [Myxococcota bacterium]|nr:ATP synthase subunit b [Myxococcota bacterium]
MDLIGQITSPLVLVQLGILLVLYSLLKVFLFDRYADLYDERQKRLAQGSEGVQNIAGEVEALTGKIESRLKDARAEALKNRLAAREEALKTEKTILDEARAGVQVRLSAASKELQAQTETARATLEKESRRMASVLASKLLGRQAG